MTQEHFPSFFNQAPTITVRDPLAEFLGAAQDGILTYRYADAVRLCGHSCPTVAGAYLMVIKGLKALYGEELPQRGDIEAFMQGERDEGTVGVTASVVQLLTGAAPETGFGGVGTAGRFARRAPPPRYRQNRCRQPQRRAPTLCAANARHHAQSRQRQRKPRRTQTIRRTLARTRPRLPD